MPPAVLWKFTLMIYAKISGNEKKYNKNRLLLLKNISKKDEKKSVSKLANTVLQGQLRFSSVSSPW